MRAGAEKLEQRLAETLDELAELRAQKGPAVVSEANYISAHQQRLLTLIRVLAGNEIEGLSPSEIAKLAECQPPQVTKDLANLKHVGWAEQLPTTGRWRLGPEIVQIATRHMTALSKARSRLDETTNRYSRT